MSDIWDKEIELTPKDKKRLGMTDEQEDCYMTFDGKNLGLYNKGIQINNLDAMSGQPN
jgi:hypothetical protein